MDISDPFRRPIDTPVFIKNPDGTYSECSIVDAELMRSFEHVPMEKIANHFRSGLETCLGCGEWYKITRNHRLWARIRILRDGGIPGCEYCKGKKGTIK
jgi:hypothetical protein